MLKRLMLPAALLALACSGPGLAGAQNKQPADAPPARDAVNVRAQTRNKLFTSKPEELGLTGADAEAKVWGVLIELGFPDGATTLFSLRDGTARISTSDTDGLAYGGSAAQAEAKKLVAEAEKHLGRMKPAKDFPYPGDGRVRFYLLTRDGVYTTEAERDAAGGEGHPLYPLALAGHQVLIKVQDAAAKRRPGGTP